MRRILGLARGVPSLTFAWATARTSASVAGTEDGGGANSFAGVLDREKLAEKNREPHPLVYDVPVLSTRTVGREAEVMALWQNLLAGRHCQVLVGVDGIGKSTVASEFSDAVRQSGRFTCIQWFNGQEALHSQLERFFAAMRERREKDVLLVLDDVADPESVAAFLPTHKSVFILMTSSNAEAVPSPRMSVSPVPALSPVATEELAVAVNGAEAGESTKAVLDRLGFVPLLVNLASSLLAAKVVCADDLLDALTARQVMRDGTLRVSHALRVLLDFAVDALAKEHPAARQQLAKLSCFHLSDVSDAVIQAACGDDGAQLAVAAAQLRVLSLKWEDSAFAVHPTVAAVLRGSLTDGDLHAAATALKSLWPRRWREMSSRLVYNLVWHTYAMSKHFAERRMRFTGDLMESMDRSAAFLAHGEHSDLAIAASLWYSVFSQQQEERCPTKEAVRVARECGRLLHFLRDERAHGVLQAAYDGATSVYGQDAAETALIMGCLAPYLDASSTSADRLARSAESLEAALSSTDVVRSTEETRMLLETLFVVVVRRGQVMKEMGQPVPDALWASLDSVKERLRPFVLAR